MKKILYLIPLLIFCNCNNDEEQGTSNNDNNFNIESYYAFYANYATSIFPYDNPDSSPGHLVKIQYDSNGRIIKRIGDILYISPNTGLGPMISDSLFTDLEYFENKVKLTKGISYLGFSTLENESIITFDSQNRILKKTNRYETNMGLKMDTINYNYINNKLMSYIKTSNEHISGEEIDIRRFEESNLYYNTNNNLDSIVTISSMKLSNRPYTTLLNRKTLVFQNYDTSFNPFKKLRIFEETFYRSLSNNNYRKYIEKSNGYQYPNYDFYAEPIMTPATINKVLNWNFSYDFNGNWMYNLP